MLVQLSLCRTCSKKPHCWFSHETAQLFLGEFTDCLLPAKKLMGTKNHDFMDSKRDAFEQYLQVSGKIENMSPVVNKRDTDQQCSYCTALL